MSRYSSNNMSPEQFLTLAANCLYQTFFENQRVDAKRMFKELAKGQRVAMIRVNMEDDSQLDLYLRMDNDAYQGKQSFSAFREQLALLLTRIRERFEREEDANLYGGENTQQQLFNIPAVVTEGDNVNVLVLGFEPANLGAMTLNLVYLEPDQFEFDKTAGQEA